MERYLGISSSDESKECTTDEGDTIGWVKDHDQAICQQEFMFREMEITKVFFVKFGHSDSRKGAAAPGTDQLLKPNLDLRHIRLDGEAERTEVEDEEDMSMDAVAASHFPGPGH